jgi:hypothetical protein
MEDGVLHSAETCGVMKMVLVRVLVLVWRLKRGEVWVHVIGEYHGSHCAETMAMVNVKL